MLVKFGVPKSQNMYRYDYHVKNFITVMTAWIFIVHRSRPIYFLIYHYCYKVDAFHKHIMTESLFYISVVLLFYVHGKHLRSCRDGQLT